MHSTSPRAARTFASTGFASMVCFRRSSSSVCMALTATAQSGSLLADLIFWASSSAPLALPAVGAWLSRCMPPSLAWEVPFCSSAFCFLSLATSASFCFLSLAISASLCFLNLASSACELDSGAMAEPFPRPPLPPKGSRVKVTTLRPPATGTVRFVGPTALGVGTWVGVELDEERQGLGDGRDTVADAAGLQGSKNSQQHPTVLHSGGAPAAVHQPAPSPAELLKLLEAALPAQKGTFDKLAAKKLAEAAVESERKASVWYEERLGISFQAAAAQLKTSEAAAAALAVLSKKQEAAPAAAASKQEARGGAAFDFAKLLESVGGVEFVAGSAFNATGLDVRQARPFRHPAAHADQAMGQLGHRKPAPKFSRGPLDFLDFQAATLTARGNPPTVIIIHLRDGLGAAGLDIQKLQQAGALLRGLRGDWIQPGDFDAPPAQLATGGQAQEAQGHIVRPGSVSFAQCAGGRALDNGATGGGGRRKPVSFAADVGGEFKSHVGPIAQCDAKGTAGAHALAPTAPQGAISHRLQTEEVGLGKPASYVAESISYRGIKGEACARATPAPWAGQQSGGPQSQRALTPRPAAATDGADEKLQVEAPMSRAAPQRHSAREKRKQLEELRGQIGQISDWAERLQARH
ncbi:unnamed protein product [Prorocentrum cordatum]|uniref:CAP-Gly domain-containing protein n=1 Tax=Prorocentrum cordatum TaxID=2364126 RepID=A0ABN9RID2_9DINO|nr:unnamed protein product [Polarella glacialis]